MTTALQKGDDRRRRILEFLRTFYAEQGIPPTQRQIAEGVDTNLSNVNRHLQILLEAGEVRQVGNPKRPFYRAVED